MTNKDENTDEELSVEKQEAYFLTAFERLQQDPKGSGT